MKKTIIGIVIAVGVVIVAFVATYNLTYAFDYPMVTAESTEGCWEGRIICNGSTPAWEEGYTVFVYNYSYDGNAGAVEITSTVVDNEENTEIDRMEPYEWAPGATDTLMIGFGKELEKFKGEKTITYAPTYDWVYLNKTDVMTYTLQWEKDGKTLTDTITFDCKGAREGYSRIAEMMFNLHVAQYK